MMEVDDALELAKKYRKMTGENPCMKKDQQSFERDVDFLQGKAPEKPDLTKAIGVALKIKR